VELSGLRQAQRHVAYNAPMMYTQCPECLTIYRLDGSELAGTHGNVYCNNCKALFDALRTLTQKLPPGTLAHLPAHQARITPPLLVRPAARPAYWPYPPQAMPPRFVPPQAIPPQVMPPQAIPPQAVPPQFVPPQAIPPQTGPSQFALFADTRTSPAKPAPQPAFVAHRHGSHPARNWPWILGSALLLLTLAGEFAWDDREELLENPGVRAWLDPVCAWLGCRLPLRHDPSALELLSRDIRPHPSVPGALLISATLRNAAAFAQPFPVVAVALSDFDEKPVAMRRFQPSEYLDDPRAIAEGLAPGASTALVFEVADPGKNAVAFEFNFQ
jgi:predicted Zn finger-like uncharacterized protein